MVSINLILLSLCSLIFCADAKIECQKKTDTFFAAEIYLFYAPQYSEIIREQIVIYFHHKNYQLGDVIVLIENNTLTDELSSIRYTPTCSSGYIFTTKPALNSNHDSIPKFITQLEGHCAYWERNYTRSKHFCLTSHPRWMYDLRSYIGNQPLYSLFIPGTHQSGSYSQRYPQSLVNKFVAAQDQNVLEQLIYGARYLDLRPSCVHGVYFNSHNFVPMCKMHNIINHIREFLDNTQEILIVSFKEFRKGFEMYKDHVDFVNYLKIQFNDYLLHKTDQLWSITMNEIWNSNKRLIIAYDHDIIMERVSFIWPHIIHEWGNIPPNGNLQKFIANTEQLIWQPKVTIAAYTIPSHAILINIARYMLGLSTISLHDLAVSVGPDITQYYNELHQITASVVAVDYIQATGIVDVAIEWNKRRSCRSLN